MDDSDENVPTYILEYAHIHYSKQNLKFSAPEIYQVMVANRDKYMAKAIQETRQDEVNEQIIKYKTVYFVITF